MSTDDFLKQYAQALAEHSVTENRLKLLEMRAKLELITPAQPTKPKKQTPIEQYIAQHRHLMEQCDIEFLTKTERDTTEVADYCEIHRNEVSKRLRDFTYKPGRHDRRGKRMVDTLSVVMEQLGHGETSGEQQ